MKKIERTYNFWFSPMAMDRLKTVGGYEGVDINEVIRRSVYVNKVLVEQKAKTIKVDNRYKYNFEDGLLQPYNPEFYVTIYDGLVPKSRDMPEIMKRPHKLSDLFNIYIRIIDLSQNFIDAAKKTNTDWQKAIKCLYGIIQKYV